MGKNSKSGCRLELDTMPARFGGTIELKGGMFYEPLDLKENEFKRAFLAHTEGCSPAGPPLIPLYGRES